MKNITGNCKTSIVVRQYDCSLGWDVYSKVWCMLEKTAQHNMWGYRLQLFSLWYESKPQFFMFVLSLLYNDKVKKRIYFWRNTLATDQKDGNRYASVFGPANKFQTLEGYLRVVVDMHEAVMVNNVLISCIFFSM